MEAIHHTVATLPMEEVHTGVLTIQALLTVAAHLMEVTRLAEVVHPMVETRLMEVTRPMVAARLMEVWITVEETHHMGDQVVDLEIEVAHWTPS